MDGTMDAHVASTGQNEEALASQIFENFCAASTMGKILSLFRDMCRILKLKPTVMPDFYTKLKVSVLRSQLSLRNYGLIRCIHKCFQFF